MPETTKVKLSGGPEKTATWIWLEKGQLKIEYYDYSELANRMFGNDIAYILTVTEMEKLFSITEQDEASLIRWLYENYNSYFDIKKLLEERGIAFHKEIESWA
jgi:hypothetical protein